MVIKAPRRAPPRLLAKPRSWKKQAPVMMKLRSPKVTILKYSCEISKVDITESRSPVKPKGNTKTTAKLMAKRAVVIRMSWSE
mmetsp:Transcript_96092/g.117761  ORF Transcript_96092/g.117761 Transcript_96092/m.117761 type:complete len:83 (+) Transcript_96092:152-400(+)